MIDVSVCVCVCAKFSGFQACFPKSCYPVTMATHKDDLQWNVVAMVTSWIVVAVVEAVTPACT